MKCIIVEKVQDKITGEVYKPKKDKKGNDVPQEVNQAFYDRAIKTKYIKAVENAKVQSEPEEKESKKTTKKTIEVQE